MVSYLITGANRGIGFGFVRVLSADPNNIVFATTRNVAGSTELTDLASKLNNIHVLQADITDVASLRAAAKDVEKVTGGALDVLVNNAAYLLQAVSEDSIDMYEGKEDLLDEVFGNFFKVNTLSVIKTINIFLPLLRKSSETSLAKVITITSAAGDRAFTLRTRHYFAVPYSVSKAAVNMVTAKYAARFKDENMLFLAICPGWVDTRAASLPETGPSEIFGSFMNRLKAEFPDWNAAHATPEQSVTAMLGVISKLTAKDSGACLSHKGDTENWV